MSVIYVTEYEKLARDNYGNIIQAGLEPAITTQTVTVGASTAKTANAFDKRTRFVRINTDVAVAIKFGGATVTATTSDARMSADQTEFFGISSASYVAGITGV